MSTTARIEKQDGTIVDDGGTWTYPYQLKNHASTLAQQDPNPQVYIFIWDNKGKEIRVKYFSPSCWELDTYAIEMFEQMLGEHDWYYDYSDDHRVWQKGRTAYDVLLRKYSNLIYRKLTPSAKLLVEQFAPPQYRPAFTAKEPQHA